MYLSDQQLRDFDMALKPYAAHLDVGAELADFKNWAIDLLNWDLVQLWAALTKVGVAGTDCPAALTSAVEVGTATSPRTNDPACAWLYEHFVATGAPNYANVSSATQKAIQEAYDAGTLRLGDFTTCGREVKATFRKVLNDWLDHVKQRKAKGDAQDKFVASKAFTFLQNERSKSANTASKKSGVIGGKYLLYAEAQDGKPLLFVSDNLTREVETIEASKLKALLASPLKSSGTWARSLSSKLHLQFDASATTAKRVESALKAGGVSAKVTVSDQRAVAELATSRSRSALESARTKEIDDHMRSEATTEPEAELRRLSSRTAGFDTVDEAVAEGKKVLKKLGMGRLVTGMEQALTRSATTTAIQKLEKGTGKYWCYLYGVPESSTLVAVWLYRASSAPTKKQPEPASSTKWCQLYGTDFDVIRKNLVSSGSMP